MTTDVTPTETAEALNNRGAARAAAGDRAGAFADYDAALALNPRLAAALNNRAVARFQAGDLHAALADLRAAVAIDPGYADAYENCATVHDRLSEHAKAVACHDRAIALHAADGRRPRRLCKSYVLRALALHHLGQLSAAADDLRAAYRLDPRVCAAAVAGILVRNARDPESAALAQCDAHLARHPADGFTLGRRALTHLALGHRAAFEADLAAAAWLLGSAEDAAAATAFARAVEARITINSTPGA